MFVNMQLYANNHSVTSSTNINKSIKFIYKYIRTRRSKPAEEMRRTETQNFRQEVEPRPCVAPQWALWLPIVALSVTSGTSLATRCMGAMLGPSRESSSPESTKTGSVSVRHMTP